MDKNLKMDKKKLRQALKPGLPLIFPLIQYISKLLTFFQCFVPITDGNASTLLDELEWKYKRKAARDANVDLEEEASKVIEAAKDQMKKDGGAHDCSKH